MEYGMKLLIHSQNFNEVWQWISNFISHVTGHVITYPCWIFQLIHGSRMVLSQQTTIIMVAYQCSQVTSTHWKSPAKGSIHWQPKFKWVATTWTSRWRHQMETFSVLLAFCAGNSPVPSEFPSQRPVTRSFDIFFDLCLNKHLGKQSRRWWDATGPIMTSL